MEKMWALVKRIVREEEGMETVEYAVVGALVVAVTIGVWTLLGEAIKAKIEELTTMVSG